jgi:cardiolipin-specific phospholipase
LSFVPYLQKPPTHTQTESAPCSTNASTASISNADSDKVTPVTTNSVTDPYGPRSWSSNLIKLSGRNRALNEFSVERVGEEVSENLVMLHGYGAGLGFFYKNFEGLTRSKGWKLYALDLLGMGRSSRPPFTIRAKDHDAKITEAENWFIDALEEWRVRKEIDKFTLIGHSLGGYMAVAYALKYPGHLKKLILASPVGIPEDPYAVSADMPEPEESTFTNEFTQDQESTVSRKLAADNNNFLNARSKAEEANAKDVVQSSQPPRRPIPKWLTYLWEANISPFSLVRWAGPLGPRLVSGWTSRRFSHLPPDEAQALHDYSYSLFRQPGSGEYALAYILAPGAFARSPLIRRIHKVGRQTISPQPVLEEASLNAVAKPNQVEQKEYGIPIVLMYGDSDWMDVAGGFAAEQKINEEKERLLKGASEEERNKDKGSAKVVIIKKAGHHVYLDGWEEWNDVMREEMRDVQENS